MRTENLKQKEREIKKEGGIKKVEGDKKGGDKIE